MIFKTHLSRNQSISLGPEFSQTLSVKREDLIHSQISGNKFRKLTYNISQAKAEKRNTLLTFGGAFSNHILAVAVAGKTFGMATIGIIRGEELVNQISTNSTLKMAAAYGMQLKFVTRQEYRQKKSSQFIQHLKESYGDFYLIPEGGTNALAIKGCEEILTPNDAEFDFICCSVGTGGTISGIINASKEHQQILGFPALRGDFLNEEIRKFAKTKNWQLIPEYHFGGYAKINSELISFINQFKETHRLPLDPVYTGKLLWGIMDLLEQGFFPRNSKILAIHTGGLQGISGMNALLKKKQMLLIK